MILTVKAMTDKHESTGYYTKRPSKREREEAIAQTHMDKMRADLADTTGKYSLDNDPDEGDTKGNKQEIDCYAVNSSSVSDIKMQISSESKSSILCPPIR